MISVNINTNNIFTRSYLTALPLIAILATSIWPQYALAASEIIHPSHGLIFVSHTIFDKPISASYLFNEGAVLGVTVSAYSSTVEQTDGDPFTTASGTRVHEGTAATNFLPLGTIVRIGSRLYTVEDRMNSRYDDSYHFDIWMDSYDSARIFGVRRAVLEVVSVPQ